MQRRLRPVASRSDGSVILRCTFEELSALTAGAKHALAVEVEVGSRVAAPPRALADVEALLPRLTGDLSVTTYPDQESVERAVNFILDRFREHMDQQVLAEHPGAESAIVAFFDYAHVLTVSERLRLMGQEMAAMIALMTGQPPTPESARRINFPD